MLRDWGPRRWAAAGATAAAAALLLSTASAPFEAGPGWGAMAVALLAVGSAALGMLAGTYLRAPAGAQPTVCDLRWPLLGAVGLSLATTGAPSGLLAQLLAGLPEAAIRWAVQPGLGAAAIAVTAAALHRRLGIAADALSGPATGPACSTCRPLFPR
ncbi:hypothetical protein LK10_08475 [Sinomonas humi]|uniref:Uncharacterized protein n=1 Tax=Sinomonas humi TaxID=1338436 RepID=A0A0B2AP57_9MICC|nr:hypothetical protein LK10_08475 [Sinomonas humi]